MCSQGALPLQGVGPVEISRLLWGLAVLDHLHKAAAASLYKKLGTLPLALLTAESLDQILQVALLCCAVLCCAVLCRAVPCCAVPGRAMPCRAVLCCAVVRSPLTYIMTPKCPTIMDV